MAGRTVSRQGTTSRPRKSTGRPRGRALVASSAYYAGNVAPRIYGGDAEWQNECYRHYGIIGEARYGANYWGAAMSKCEMYMEAPTVAKDGTDRSWAPAYNSPEQMALDDMFSGRNNQPEALAAIGVHKTIAGECFILGFYVGDPEAYTQSTVGDNSMDWQVVPPVEMSVNGAGGWMWTDPETQRQRPLTEMDVVIRLWWSDPKRRNKADSPFKSNLPVLREIELATEHIESQLVSRLSGAGILWVPDGLDLPDMPIADETEEEATKTATLSGPSKLMKYIATVGSTAIKSRSSAAARVPIIIQAPDELIDKAKLMHFWSEMDEKVGEVRDKAIHRFVAGMDLPNEMLEGMASNGGTGGGTSNGVSHWGAWQIEESAIKMHIEPGMDVVCSAITIDWVRVQVPNSEMRVAYSASKLKGRPDRSKESIELYNLGLVNAACVRRENGFAETDAMGDTERKAWLLTQMATGSNTPDQVAWANSQLGAGDPPAAVDQATTNEARPAPTLEDHPTRPKTPEYGRMALQVACNAMVLQALSRVGNRLVNQKAGRVVPPAGVATYAVHTFAIAELDPEKLLTDAFPHANELLCGIADPADVMPLLQRYTYTLVSARVAHDVDQMMTWLKGVEIA